MSINNKTMKQEICEGCLSKGRILIPITQYLRLYKLLMEDFIKEEPSYETPSSIAPLMCWECRGYLRNTEAFVQRAKAAREALLTMGMNTSKVLERDLSTLTIAVLNNYDYDVTHEETYHKAYVPIEIDKVEEEPKFDTSYDEELQADEAKCEIKEEIEFEIEENVKMEESDYNYNDDIETDIADARESEENTEEIPEAKHELNLESIVKRKAKRELPQFKFRLIKYDDYRKSFHETCHVEKVDREELDRLREKARERHKYVKAQLKCENCIIGFFNEKFYKKHFKKYHDKSKKFECDICQVRFTNKAAVSTHMSSHMYKYVCRLCEYVCLKRNQICFHLAYTHQRAVECKECGLRLNYNDFYKHYKSMHTKHYCDHCEYRSGKKERLANHIRVLHGDNKCQFCSKKYVKYHSLMQHIELCHTKKVTEESYCVECNIQFDNTALFQRHIKESVKHKVKKSYPCPECNKVYAKNIAMRNHYNYIHLQKTKFVCEPCSRYFLNGFSLRNHIAGFHNKIPPRKNKICPQCGRAFTTNRCLDNHMRTHTGERPFACAHCNASFSQKCALVSHSRSIHKINMRYAEKAE